MSKLSARAGAPEFEFEGGVYEFPADDLVEIANRVDEDAEALIMPEHCIEAVPLVLRALRKVGWEFSPPASPEIENGLDVFYEWWEESGLSRDGGLTDPDATQVRSLLERLFYKWKARLAPGTASTAY